LSLGVDAICVTLDGEKLDTSKYGRIAEATSHIGHLSHALCALRMAPHNFNSKIKENSMLNDFKAFIMKGNVLDLAVAVIIGAAFGAIVTSMVNDIVMPPIGLLLSGVDFKDLFVALNGETYANLAAAKTAAAPVIAYGVFLNAVINFLIVAFVIFMVVRAASKLQKPIPAPAPATKDCGFCFTAIPIPAKRCPHCTSQLV
jgi:large conductance mechanosensitive channel